MSNVSEFLDDPEESPEVPLSDQVAAVVTTPKSKAKPAVFLMRDGSQRKVMWGLGHYGHDQRAASQAEEKKYAQFYQKAANLITTEDLLGESAARHAEAEQRLEAGTISDLEYLQMCKAKSYHVDPHGGYKTHPTAMLLSPEELLTILKDLAAEDEPQDDPEAPSNDDASSD